MLTALRPDPERLRERVTDFRRDVVYPGERIYHEQHAGLADRRTIPLVMEKMKSRDQAAGLGNLWLPDSAFWPGRSRRQYPLPRK